MSEIYLQMPLVDKSVWLYTKNNGLNTYLFIRALLDSPQSPTIGEGVNSANLIIPRPKSQ
jgi:hypothetical protein